MARGIVYRAVKPKWGVFAVKTALSGIVFLAAAFMIELACAEYIRNEDYGTLIPVGLISLGLFALILVIVIKSLKNEKRVLDGRRRLLDSLSECGLERLEEEAAASVKYFGCIYLLSEYLFVPKAGLLIRYEDIGNYKSVYHSTNGIPDGVFVEVYDRENVKYRFSVNKWREYKRDYSGYMSTLDIKMNGGVPRERETNGYEPVNG